MSTGMIILLGAFAGLTIYLGLPLAFFEKAPRSFKAFSSMLAVGILVFLFFDVIGKASEPINEALSTLHEKQVGGVTVAVDILVVVLGFMVGLLGLVYFNKYVIARYRPASICKDEAVFPSSLQPLARVSAHQDVHATVSAEQESDTRSASTSSAGTMAISTQEEWADAEASSAANASPVGTVVISTQEHISSLTPSPRALSLIIAMGIGLHNFSEGLAIGQSTATGQLTLAAILIIGFALHNMTEGFGIAGPLTNQRVSWQFIVLVGLIGGGPTFLGTATGIVYHSDLLFILFLALAAGSILYVIVEMLGVVRRNASLEIITWGLCVGFLLGYLSDLLVTYAGA